MSKLIEFIATDMACDYFESPMPSQKNTPSWYKDIPLVRDKDISFGQEGQINNLTVKHCIPFYDAISFGYQAVLSTDIYMSVKDGVFDYKYPARELVSHREGKPSIPISDDFAPVEFVWKMNWVPKTPKGYSCLITHPLNRVDLPFLTLSGVVDSDVFYHSPNGNLPFYLKRDFEGIIKKGTPIAQVIPFKRDNWKSQRVNYDHKKVEKREFQRLSVLKDFYKKFAYVKKVFK